MLIATQHEVSISGSCKIIFLNYNVTKVPLGSRRKECAIRWWKNCTQNLREMATDLIITIFCRMSGGKKDSKGWIKYCHYVCWWKPRILYPEAFLLDNLQIETLQFPWDAWRELEAGWSELLSVLPPCQRHWKDLTESCWLLFHQNTWNEICFWSTNKLVHVQLTTLFYLSY